MLIVDISASDYQKETKQYQFGGYLLFKNFFENKTEEQVKTENQNLQNSSKIPLLIAVDEEGGNVVTSIDETLPASISLAIYKLLREELNLSGIIITDDMKMGAIGEEYNIEETVVKAILAGNDMIILSIDHNTTNKKTGQKVTYQKVVEYVKSVVQNGDIQEEIINQSVKRILAWKYYKELM